MALEAEEGGYPGCSDTRLKSKKNKPFFHRHFDWSAGAPIYFKCSGINKTFERSCYYQMLYDRLKEEEEEEGNARFRNLRSWWPEHDIIRLMRRREA